MKHTRTAALLAIFLAAGLYAAPQFTNVTLKSTNVVLRGYNGASNGSYTLLTATNFANWTPVVTNEFDSNGLFILTNVVNTSVSQQFYALQTPPPPNASWTPECGAWMGAACTNNDGSQWNMSVSNLEAQIGRQLDVLRDYHTPGSWSNLSSTELAYIHAGRKLLASVKPSNDWTNAIGAANGGSATVDAQMASLAKSIASIAPAQIMLIVFHEPENNVTGSGGSSGTPATYVAMWHNVRHIFDTNGVTNVIWCWDIQNISKFWSLTPSLWPGNDYVDWVMWDPYQQSSTDSITNVIETGYNWLLTNSSATNNFNSKFWGLAEWGVGINSYYPTLADETNGYNAFNGALNTNNMFPRLKLISFYDSLNSAVMAGAAPALSNFANSTYMTQHCPGPPP